MMNCVWLSLWAANFITLAETMAHSSASQILMCIPVIIVMPILGLVVSQASKLSAISELDFQVIGNLLVQDNDVDTQLKEVRDALSRRLEKVPGDKIETIHQFFNEVAETKKDHITKREFKKILRMLGLYYKSTELYQLYNAVDLNRCGEVGVFELIACIFPSDIRERQRQRDEALLKAATHKRLMDEQARLVEQALEEEGEGEGGSASRRRVSVMSSMSLRRSSSINPSPITSLRLRKSSRHILGTEDNGSFHSPSALTPPLSLSAGSAAKSLFRQQSRDESSNKRVCDVIEEDDNDVRIFDAEAESADEIKYSK